MRYFYLTLILLFFVVPATQAQDAVRGEILYCGAPITGDINVNPGYSFCDYYQRQLAYKASADSFRTQLKERQKNFAEPFFRAQRQYQEDLQAMFDEEYERERKKKEEALP